MTAVEDFVAKLQQLDPGNSADIAKIKSLPSFLQTPILQQLAKVLPAQNIDTNRFSGTYLPPGTTLKQALSNPNSYSYAAVDKTSQLHRTLDQMNKLQQAAAAKSSAMTKTPTAVAASAPRAAPGSEYDKLLAALGHVNTGITGADTKQAGLLASMNYDPQISELRREQGQAKTDTQRQMQELLDALNMGTRSTSTYGKNYDKDMQEIYQVLGKQLTGLKGTEQAQYAQTGKDVAAGYNEAATTQDAAAKQLQAALGQSANTLGQQAAVGTPLEQLAAQLGVSQSRTAASKAAATGNVKQRAAEAGSAATMGITSAAREGAQKRADLRTDIANTLGQLQNTYMSGKTKLSQGLQDELKSLGGKIQDLLGAKGKDIQATAMQLSQTRSASERQALMDKLNAKLNIAQQNLAERQQSYSEKVTNEASGAGTAGDSAGWDAVRKQAGYGARSESALIQAINTARMSGQNTLTGALSVLQQAIDQEKQSADKATGKTHNPLDINYLTRMLQIFYNAVGPTGVSTTTTTSKSGTSTSTRTKS